MMLKKTSATVLLNWQPETYKVDFGEYSVCVVHKEAGWVWVAKTTSKNNKHWVSHRGYYKTPQAAMQGFEQWQISGRGIRWRLGVRGML